MHVPVKDDALLGACAPQKLSSSAFDIRYEKFWGCDLPLLCFTGREVIEAATSTISYATCPLKKKQEGAVMLFLVHSL
jgi:hypothetical protein